ncbi:MAG: beta-ketoacyl synthase N-terminal-like domain-containing protein, partial [Pirellulaceae bacterium]
MSQRVVVTGVGVVSPIGCNPDSFWAALVANRSGIGPLGSIPKGILQVQCGAEAREFTSQIDQFGPMEKGLERQIRKGQKVMCREIEMGVAACQWALHDCGLDASRRDPQRTG